MRCPECRATFFHEWLNRVIDRDRVTRPSGREARNFHGISQSATEPVDYIHHVEDTQAAHIFNFNAAAAAHCR